MKKPITKVPKNIKKKDIFNKKIKKNFVFEERLISYGFFGIKASESFKITFKEVEAIRRAVSFNYKNVKIWFKIEFNEPLKIKASSSRMGKGKGKLSVWVFTVKKGVIFMELEIPQIDEIIKKILFFIKERLPIKILIISRKNSIL